jgi:hypothetical protein
MDQAIKTRVLSVSSPMVSLSTSMSKSRLTFLLNAKSPADIGVSSQGPGGKDTQCSIKGFEGACAKVSVKVTPFGTETGNAPPPTGPEGLPNNGKFSAADTTQPEIKKPARAKKGRAVPFEA